VARILNPLAARTRTPHSALTWVLEAFERDATYLHKRMFGCDAAYIDGNLCVVVADRDDPWNGVLVCTSQDRHAALMADIPALQPHPVLGKWLYVSQHDAGFEAATASITSLILERDPRIGVEPKPRTRRSKTR